MNLFYTISHTTYKPIPKGVGNRTAKFSYEFPNLNQAKMKFWKHEMTAKTIYLIFDLGTMFPNADSDSKCITMADKQK